MSASEFNETLFQLVDEMMGIVDPSPVIKTAYAVFKGSNTDSCVALDAFWDLAKDEENGRMIAAKDLKAMADVLRGVVPIPGMVDDVWERLSEDNREVVGEYISVLYEIAAKVKSNDPVGATGNAGDDGTSLPIKEAKDATLYGMYNSIWKDFLMLLQHEHGKALDEAVLKLDHVMTTKGPSNTMVYGVLLPAMELVLPRQRFESEADIVTLCLPPHNAAALVKKDVNKLDGMLFPFDRKVPFSNMLRLLLDTPDKATRERLGTYWHYLKLFTVCLKECPPEAMGMMDYVVKLVQGSLVPPA